MARLDPLEELKPDLKEAEKRWLAFWEHELVDRPCCIMRAPRDGVAAAPHPPCMAGARGDLEAAPRQAEADRALRWLVEHT